MLDQAINASDLGVTQDYLLKVLLLGPTGSGKTQSSITLPRASDDERPILILDIDQRAETLAGLPFVKIIKILEPSPDSPRAWDSLETALKELVYLAKKCLKEDLEFPYLGIVEDGLSSMARICMNSAITLDPKKGLGGAPAQQHYMPQITWLVKHINAMKLLPCHYILTGHLDIEKDEDLGEIRALPKITKSLRTEIPSWFNEVYYTYRTPGEGGIKYLWMTKGSGKLEYFKSTLNNLGKYWEDPIVIDFNEKPVGFADLFQRRFKNVSNRQ